MAQRTLRAQAPEVFPTEQLMDKRFKWAGAAMVVGGFLMFTRMAPIFVILPDDMAFPLETTQEMVRLAGIAGARWQLSHIMGLAAVVLFAVAYGWHVSVLMRIGWKRVGVVLAVMAAMAFGLFGTALLIDGFVVPATIESFVSTNEGQSMTLEQVAGSHQLALRFYTPGMFLLFVTIGLFSSPMLHRVIHARWLGFIGQIIAISAVTAYLTGLTGSDWNNLQVAGTLMLAAFAWHVLVGSRALFSGSSISANQG